jgi:hypothetical protein
MFKYYSNDYLPELKGEVYYGKQKENIFNRLGLCNSYW